MNKNKKIVSFERVSATFWNFFYVVSECAFDNFDNERGITLASLQYKGYPPYNQEVRRKLVLIPSSNSFSIGKLTVT